MNEFLFLYPTQGYVDKVVKRASYGTQLGQALCERLNQIVQLRYRQGGYGVNWLMFSNEPEPLFPEAHILAKEIAIEPSDKLLISGVTPEAMICEGLYPNPQHIIAQLPQIPERLVLGGFHRQDCVDKLLKAVEREGISTFVDENTTDVFFKMGLSSLTIPIDKDIFAEV